MATATTKDFDILKFFQEAALPSPGRIGTNCGIVEGEKGDLNIGKNKGCHAYMSEYLYYHQNESYQSIMDCSPVKAVYTTIWSHTYDDSVLELVRFILNERWSPWREHIKGREILWGTWTDGRKIPVAVKFTNMGANTQVIFNVMLMLRIIYAQPSLVRAYELLRKQGFTRTESLYLAANFGVSPQGTCTYPYLGDFPFDTAFAEMDWKRWSEGKPKFFTERTLAKSSNYSPCNAIWNKDDKTSGIVISNKNRMKNTSIQNLVSEEKEHTNVFGKKQKGRIPLAFEEAVKKLKSDKEAWKCPVSTSPAEEPTVVTPSSLTSLYADMVTQSFVPLTNSSTLSFFTVPSSGSLQSSTGSYQLESSQSSI